MALVGLAALFLVCAGGGVALWVADPFGWFGGGSADLLAWMPADTRAVEGLDPAEVGKNPHALAVLRADLKAAESVGIKAEDMAAVMQGKKTAKGEVEVTVVRLKASPDQDRIRQAAGGTEATANGKTYYRTRAGGGLYFAPGRVVVLTRSEDAMTGLLQKEPGKVVVPDDLKSAVGRASGHLWGAAVGPEANLFAPPPGKDAPAGVTPPPAPTVTVMTAQLAGPDEVSLKLELTYRDADTARKAADQIDGLARQNKSRLADMEKLLGKGPNPAARKMQDAKKMFDTLAVAATGPSVVITATLTVDSLESFGKAGGLGGL